MNKECASCVFLLSFFQFMKFWHNTIVFCTCNLTSFIVNEKVIIVLV